MSGGSCKSIYYMNGLQCSRNDGHAGEHCHTIWDRNLGQRNVWWNDSADLKHWETVMIDDELCRVVHVTKDDGTEGVTYVPVIKIESGEETARGEGE